MIPPPIFQALGNDFVVRDLLGSNPLRFFEFGLAPQGVAKPYGVWQSVSGSPETYLAGRPDAETHTIQIDIYADSSSKAREVAAAIEYAIELQCNITRYGGMSRDPETMNYRISMDVTWITSRCKKGRRRYRF